MKDIIVSQINTRVTRKDIVITKELYEAIIAKYHITPCYDTRPEDLSFESYYQMVIGNKQGVYWVEYDHEEKHGHTVSHRDYYTGDSDDYYVEAGLYRNKHWLTSVIQNIIEEHFNDLESYFGVKVSCRTDLIENKDKMGQIAVPSRETLYV